MDSWRCWTRGNQPKGLRKDKDGKAQICSQRFERCDTIPQMVGQWDLGKNPKLA